jgi:hypothetical protein
MSGPLLTLPLPLWNRKSVYMSRQEMIRLHGDNGGLNPNDATLPPLIPMMPVTRPIDPEPLDSPRAPVPFAPIWIAICEGIPASSSNDRLTRTSDPDGVVPMTESLYAVPV